MTILFQLAASTFATALAHLTYISIAARIFAGALSSLAQRRYLQQRQLDFTPLFDT